MYNKVLKHIVKPLKLKRLRIHVTLDLIFEALVFSLLVEYRLYLHSIVSDIRYNIEGPKGSSTEFDTKSFGVEYHVCM